jgi:phosphatidylinositol alpha-1,6-mannosyltransferase
VHALAIRQPLDSLVVLTSSWRGAAEFDREQPFPVVRQPTSVLLPTPDVRRVARRLVREHGCDTAWFGAAAPLGLLADGLREVGVRRAVAQTHGHEVGWASVPGGRALLRRIARGCDVVTYLGEYTRRRLSRAIGGLTSLRRLTPGVDLDVFNPDLVRTVGAAARRRLGLAGRPVVVCVSRLVPRKGQDTLIRALPEIRRQVPGAALLLVSGGPDAPRLHRLAALTGVAEDVVFTGSVERPELPAYYAAGDVFAMPCRTRAAGLDVEGLGMVYLEASAVGLPVVAGRSGGAPDAVRPGETGLLVDGQDVSDVAQQVGALLGDPDRAHRMGAAGRAWVEREWRWDVIAERMTALLSGAPALS